MSLSYVYTVKNTATGEFYFGSRCRNVFFKRSPENDFWIYYFTSSKSVKSLIELHGKDSFEISILHTDESYEICYWMEQVLIKGSIDNCFLLNRHYIDPIDGNRKFSTKGKIHTIESKDKISLSHKIRDPERESLRIERQKMTKSNRTAEEQKVHSERISSGRKNMTDEAKAERIRKQSESMRLYHQRRKQININYED